MTTKTSVSSPAVDSVGAADSAGFPSARAILERPGLMFSLGAVLGREATMLVAEAIRIGLGRSGLKPRAGDHRFADAAWSTNPLFRRLAQTYLASCRAVDNVVDSLEEKDWAHAEAARFATTILTSAAAPTNFLVANPAALKLAFDTGGASLVKGMKNWVTDLQSNGGMPSTSMKGQFVVGADLAATPGAVVARDDVAELIQYAPVTDKVFERPTLVVPPPIGRFYFLDLAPGRSFVEYATSRGVQTFLVSWRNPTKEQAGWDIDTYAQRVLDAVEEVREVTGQERINVIGFCAGGILTTVALNRLAAAGGDPVESAAFAVTMLDFAGRNPINTFGYAPLLSLASWNSRRKGVIDAAAMGTGFTWMRPDDLVWNYWVNNYLMGQDPPAFDILAWNADGTSLPATLHAQFLDIFRRNPLPQPGVCEYLGEPLDLASIEMPTFVMGAINDHLTPWRATYRTTELLSGETTYVLSNAGHIASLVNPPGNPRASYFTGSGAGSVDADAWRADAEKRSGTWWEAWADWTIQRAGAEVDARPELGSLDHPVLDAAPGLYVRDSLPG